MQELIYKQEAHDKLKYMYLKIEAECGFNDVTKGLRIACKAIGDIIAVDTESVRRGRWIQSDALDYKDPNGVIHVHGMCSCCRLIYDFRDMTSRFKFCPNCGADMREASEDATD